MADITLFESIEIHVQAVNVFCFPLRAFCKSVWSLSVQVICHQTPHQPPHQVADMTLFASILIPVPAVYFVSTALIVPLLEIDILLHAVNFFCFQSNAFFKSVWSVNVQVICHHTQLPQVDDITLLASIVIQVQAVSLSCLSSKASCKSVWLDNVQLIFHQETYPAVI